MSIRYKSALVSLIVTVIAYAWYFAALMHGGGPDGLVPLRAPVLLIAGAQMIGALLVRYTASDRAVAMDERERAFDRRATNIGYYLLLFGVLLAAGFLRGRGSAADLASVILLVAISAECGRQAVFLALHHRAA